MNNNGADHYGQMESSHFTTMNNSIIPVQNLDIGMSNLFITNDGFYEEYRMRLNSEDLGHQRPISCLRRANTLDGNLDFGSNQLGISTSLLGNASQWFQDGYGDAKIRDLYARDAQQQGFIVGEELEMVKANSHRSVIQNTPIRITSSFKDRYGQSDPGCKKSYLQLGVRVPTKEHVSEIVGKQGSKIKQIRDKTGALITTPGEHEDHVFIIEALPHTALHVAQILQRRAEDITVSRSQDIRRRSSLPTNNRHTAKSPASGTFLQTNTRVVLASGKVQVPKVIVGRIIGTQGSIITTIQRDTGTEIRSPPKEVGKPKHSMADFEILVYQTANISDIQEAKQRVNNARQLIAHLAIYQLEKIRAEEAPYSNYQVQTLVGPDKKIPADDGTSIVGQGDDGFLNTEKSVTEKIRQFDWIWSDITKLEDNVAREVVNRILEESKKKTKTRSEPSIYDNCTNNLAPHGESESFSIRCSDLNRPRHSLPETRIGGFSGIGQDLFYRSSIQSNLQYPEGDEMRTEYNENDMICFQSNDFVDNHEYIGGNHCPNTEMQNEQIFLNNIDQLRYINSNLGMTDQYNSPFPYPVDNNHWRYIPSSSNIRSNSSTTPPKTYADSVRPLTDQVKIFKHGTIGDHLKKVNNYKS